MKEKKYKLKIKNIKIIGIAILVIVAMILLKPAINIFSLMGKDYSFNEALEINKKDMHDEIVKKGYSEVIAKTISDKNFKKENLDIYYKIKYYNNKNFIDLVNKLIKQGYDSKEIDIINEKKDEVINEYLTNNYVEHIDEWLKYDYFKSENIERYLNNFDGNYKDTIIKVNIGLDKEFYKDPNIITEFSPTVLANKYNKLDETFTPKNLTTLNKCSGVNQFLSIEAKEAYDKMCDASIKDGLKLSITSSYRSYESQQEVYDTYLKLYGQSYVDKYVAIPGYSEHQTGLALDVKSENSSIFKNSKEYKWMLDNSYKYGFILRYPENKKDITGYNSEAWHFRYVGIEAATYIKENNITFDEYYVMFIDK